MKKIVIIAPYYMDLETTGNNRTNFLPQFLHENGYNVEVITTNFNHTKKEHVTKEDIREYKLTMLPVTGYKRNISFKRILSVFSFKNKLKRHLKKKEVVDIVYSFVPPHSISRIAYKFAKRVNAKYVVDVRDLWPEAFQMVVKNKLLFSTIFLPFKIQANKTYKTADLIIAVSDTYKKRALSVNRKNVRGETIYLGTSLTEFDSYKNHLKMSKPKNEVWLVYIGTIGKSYDIDMLIKSYKLVIEKGYTNIKLHILGSGPNIESVKKLDNELQTNINFHGRLTYSQMVSFLVKCDIAINPIVKESYGSIINKHADYAASQLPVISTQITKEYVDIVGKYKIGFNITPGDVVDLANKIIYLSLNREIRIQMGKNHRALAEKLFNRDKIYDVLLDLL